MDGYIKVATRSDIPAGSMKTMSVNGKPLALANVDGEFFAVSDICSHAQCSLGTEGFIDDNVVTCGCHGATFDVTSGKVMSLPAVTDVASYPVKIDGGDILVKI